MRDRTLNRCSWLSERGCAAIALAMAMVGLSGCGVWQSLSVRDDNAPSLALRAVMRPQAWAKDERPGPGFELGYERFRAHSVRDLAVGETITLGQQNIVGPDAMGQVASVQFAHVVYTHPLYFGEFFQLEPFGGIANVRMRYRAEPTRSPARPELNASNTGVIGGITPRVRVNDWVAVEARFTFMPGVSVSDVYRNSAEVAAVLTPLPNLALRLGYAQRRVGVDFNVETNWTQLDVRANGPFATVQLEF